MANEDKLMSKDELASLRESIKQKRRIRAQRRRKALFRLLILLLLLLALVAGLIYAGYKIYTIGVVLNWFPIYQKSLKVLGVIKDNCCSFPKEATDFIIKLKGFEISLRTSQYIKANQIYNSWFKNIKSDIINLNCGCK